MATYAQREKTTFTWWLVLLEGILAAFFGFLLLLAPVSPLFCMRSIPAVIGD